MSVCNYSLCVFKFILDCSSGLLWNLKTKASGDEEYKITGLAFFGGMHVTCYFWTKLFCWKNDILNHVESRCASNDYILIVQVYDALFILLYGNFQRKLFASHTCTWIFFSQQVSTEIISWHCYLNSKYFERMLFLIFWLTSCFAFITEDFRERKRSVQHADGHISPWVRETWVMLDRIETSVN